MGLGPHEHCDEPLGEEPGVGLAIQLLIGGLCALRRVPNLSYQQANKELPSGIGS